MRKYTFAGKKLTLAQWADETGINGSTLFERIRSHGWTIERALTEPVMNSGQRALYRRNAEIIRRMANAFHTFPQHRNTTGGQSQTSCKPEGTGVGPSKIHCEGAKA